MSTDMLREIARDVLSGAHPEPSGANLPPVWRTIGELGWPWVGIEESAGGAGGSRADVLAVLEAIGASSATVPLLETTAVLRVAAAAGRDVSQLTGVSTIVGSVDPCAIVAEPSGDQIELRGAAEAVPWARAADRFLVIAHGGSEPRLLLCDAGLAGVSIEPGENLAGEPRDRVVLDGVRCPVGAVLAGTDLDRVQLDTALASTAQLVGAMSEAYRSTREHVTTREQFGRALVRFQLVSAGLAQMASELQLARMGLATAVNAPTPERVAAAKVTACRAATLLARTAHQLHGAMGTTREHVLHRTTRRLWAWRDEWGSEVDWSRRLGAATIELGADGLWDLLTDPTGAMGDGSTDGGGS